MTVLRVAGSVGLFVVPAVIWLLPVRSAWAQSIDYDSYEKLFGESVTASATGKPQRLSETPVEMDIITADQIARSGARTLPDILSYVSGVNVRRYGMQDTSVSIRGDDGALNRRVLVLLDGQQVYEDGYGLTVWPTIPVAIDEIQQIEVIKGPNAALYGFNAVSGVINIITRDPLLHPQNTATVQAGTQNQTYGDVVGTVGHGKGWAVRLAAEGNRSTEFDGDAADIVRQQPHSGMVSVDGRFKISPSLEWDVFGALSSLDSAYYVDLGGYAQVAFRTNSVRSRIGYDSPVGMFHLDVYRNEERVNINIYGVDRNWREDFTVVNASDLIKTGAHAFRIADEYRTTDAASLEAFRGHLGYQDGAGSGMWEWSITPRMQLTNAVRVDTLFLNHIGPSFTFPGFGTPVHATHLIEPSFNTGLILRPDDMDTLRFTVGRAAELPSLVDFGLALTYQPVVVSGQSSLTPSVATNYEMDWDRPLPRLLSTLRLSAFAQHTQSTIGPPFGSGFTLLPNGQILLLARNAGNSDEAGGEVAIKGQNPGGLRWNFSYVLAAVADRSSQTVLASIPSVNYQRQTPVNAVIAGLGYQWRSLDVDLQARWQSHYQDYRRDGDSLLAEPVTVANYLTMRLHVAYLLTRTLTVSLTADQFNRQQMPTTAGVPTGRQIVGGLHAAF
ncbi:TonB-dependent receptor plug domain-containing protein [Acetobacteraceae bacterium KSS8]|uniref:TonB-dependent receptor plug domain-containing protein n=1 Tax=Endosaccharibacter trunci TaxID=2812733 RepID=A0ABT1WBR2_9PROT|nr:TonB-dependent receptor plug domain-containing protein [Acetobacteraceae bacterium KSS8]